MKSEKEKMLLGEYYNSRDDELIADYHKAKRLLQEYNSLDSKKTERREIILKELFCKVGGGVWIEPAFYCDYGEHIAIGENTFINFNCVLLDDNKITIGKNGLLAPGVHIYTAMHPLKASDRIIIEKGNSRYLTSSRPVVIGDNVWIGGNTVIMPGVTIGNNVTLGAGSVVTKNVPDNKLAFGNPCKIIKDI
jgi:maltose O-acetyltransferase